MCMEAALDAKRHHHVGVGVLRLLLYDSQRTKIFLNNHLNGFTIDDIGDISRESLR